MLIIYIYTYRGTYVYVCTYIRTYVHTVHQCIHCLYIYIHYTLSTLLLPITLSHIYIPYAYIPAQSISVCLYNNAPSSDACMYVLLYSLSPPTLHSANHNHRFTCQIPPDQTRHIAHTTNTLLLQYTDRHLYVNNVFVI